MPVAKAIGFVCFWETVLERLQWQILSGFRGMFFQASVTGLGTVRGENEGKKFVGGDFRCTPRSGV